MNAAMITDPLSSTHTEKNLPAAELRVLEAHLRAAPVLNKQKKVNT